MKYALALVAIIIITGCVQNMEGENTIEFDGVNITWLGHASFRITDGKNIVNIDPYVLDENATKADFILITHDHFDHCDVEKTKSIQGEHTRIIAPIDCARKFSGFTNSIKAGESFKYAENKVNVFAVEAYNVNKFKSPGEPFHPKEFGVGFILEMGGKRIYHAGDTDVIDEMSMLAEREIDIALLPAGGTFTMTMAEAAEAAIIIKPRLVVPMHYNSAKYGLGGLEADPSDLEKGVAGKGITVKALKPAV